MGHEDYKDLLALEAAGALTGEESRPLAEHLSACEECRRELDDLRDTASAFAYTVAPVAPPAHVRARLLEQVRALGDSTRAAHAESEAGVKGASQALEDESVVRTPRISTRRDGRRAEDARPGLWQLLTGRPSFAFGALAAAALIIMLGITSAALWQRNQELRAETARLSARLESLEQEVAGAGAQLARAREVNELLTAPGAAMATLAGTKEAPQARASVAFDRATGRAVLLASSLPPAPAGKAYQLWFIKDPKKPLPGGVFKTGADGQGRLTDRMPEGARSGVVFAVTLEDERGVVKPAGSVFLLSGASS